MKLVAGGVSLVVLAVLAVVTTGFQADDIEPPSTESPASFSTAATNPDATPTSALFSGGAALHTAIAEGDGVLVRHLVEAGANIDEKNSLGDPTLHRATLNGNSEIMRILVNAGANINITNSFGDSSLGRTVSEGNEKFLKIILVADAS